MNKLFFIALLLTATAARVFSQDSIVILHSAIGAVIDKETKTKYVLFSEIKDPSFNYCILKKKNEDYFLYSYFHKDSLSVSRIEPEQLQEYQNNISKLNAYYANLAKRDSLKLSNKKKIDPQINTQKLEIVNQQNKDNISQQVRRDTRLKEDAERMELNKKLGRPNEAYIELFTFKGKKKKQ